MTKRKNFVYGVTVPNGDGNHTLVSDFYTDYDDAHDESAKWDALSGSVIRVDRWAVSPSAIVGYQAYKDRKKREKQRAYWRMKKQQSRAVKE